jgi:hypothetical protein
MMRPPRCHGCQAELTTLKPALAERVANTIHRLVLSLVAGGMTKLPSGPH